MVRTFVACGSEEDVLAHLERAWRVTDSICLVPPPWGLGLEATLGYQARMAKLIAKEA